MALYQLKSVYKKTRQLQKSKKRTSDFTNDNFSYASSLKERRQFYRVYGKLPLKWFINYCQTSRALPGKTTNNLLISLERRLDIFLYRIRFCSTIEAARQSINHQKVFVNGVTIDSPSYSLKPGDIIQIKEKIDPKLYHRNCLLKTVQKRNKSAKKLLIRQRFHRKNLRQYPFCQFRPLSSEINYSLSMAIFLYSPQKLYSPHVLKPTLLERSFKRTIKK